MGYSLRSVNNGSGNDLLLSDNKPLLEPMLTRIYDISRLQWVKEKIQELNIQGRHYFQN